MDLTLQEVADLLNLSEDTVQSLAKESKMPSYFLGSSYRFNRVEIENWMLQWREEFFHSGHEPAFSARGVSQFGLYRAIYHGGVATDIGGDDKISIITRVVDKLAPKLGLDQEGVVELLLDRERMMPTSLSHGLAVPHTRDFLLKGPVDCVHVVYLEDPIDWGALDQEPVHTLFFLFACDDRRHLNLLSKIAYLASDPKGVALLAKKSSSIDLLNYLKDWEGSLGSARG